MDMHGYLQEDIMYKIQNSVMMSVIYLLLAYPKKRK